MKENKLGIKIRELRHKNNLSQKDLADKLCVSDKAISKWEFGQSNPSLEMIYRLSKCFNVSIYSLLELSLTENPDTLITKEIIKDVSKTKKYDIKAIFKWIFLVGSLAIKGTTTLLNVFLKYNISEALGFISVGLSCIIIFLLIYKK